MKKSTLDREGRVLRKGDLVTCVLPSSVPPSPLFKNGKYIISETGDGLVRLVEIPRNIWVSSRFIRVPASLDYFTENE